MKKIFYGFLALAGLAMVSCSQEIDEQINANTDSVKKIFTANTEDGASTRTSIAYEEQSGNYVVIWKGDEKIAVNGVAYKVIEGAGTKSVTFGADVEGTEAETAEVYNAVYPNNAWVEGGLNLEHLKEQTAMNATYGHGYAVTVATTTDKEMDFKFKNALSFLRVRFSLAADAKEDAITIKTVKITANDNLWGTVSDVDYATGEIGAVANDSELGKSIVYTAGEDVVLDRAENAIFDAVIAVPVNTEGRTLTIEITGENAWTGTPYTYKAEGVTKKYLRNNVTTLAKAIKPVEVLLVADGVYKTAEDTFQIFNANGMKWLADAVNSGNSFANNTVQLIDNIDLSVFDNWTPIGFNENGIVESTDKYFTGTFDGQGYTIYNLNIENDNAGGVGLFGAVHDATFKNFTLKNVNIKAVDADASSDISGAQGQANYIVGGHIGAVAAYDAKAGTVTFDNVHLKGLIKIEGETRYAQGQRIAGVFGGKNSSKVVFNKVSVMGEDGSYIKGYCSTAGVVGQHMGVGTFTDVHTDIDVYGVTFGVGGIAGITLKDSTFDNCSSAGDLTLDARAVQPASYSGNYFFRIGGIAGCWSESANAKLTLTNCSYTGIFKSFNKEGNSPFAFDYDGYVGRGFTLNGCAGSTVIIDGKEFVQVTDNIHGFYMVDGVYEISSEAGLKWLAAQVKEGNTFDGKTVKLVKNIALTEPWTPIGNNTDGVSKSFRGNFDGQNYTISDMVVNAGDAAAGFFGSKWDGDIKDVNFDNATITGSHYGGVVVGWADGANYNYKWTISGCEITNSTVTLAVENNDNGDKAGAVVGYAYAITVTENVVSNTTIQAYRDFGGIVGMAQENTNTNPHSSYAVVSNNTIGENVKLIVDNTTNYQNYEIRSKYNVGQYVGRVSCHSVVDGNTGEATIEWGEIPAEIVVVATVGGVEYTELSAALEAAASSSSKTVNVAAGEHEISGDIAEGLTIVGVMDGEDYLTTIQMPDVLNAENVTIKDMKITQPLAGNHDVDKKVSAIRLNGCGTFENCYIEGYNAFYMGYSQYDMTGDVYFKDCVLKATWAYCISTGGTGNVYIEGCDLYGWNSFSKTGKVTIKNSTINSNGNYCKLRFYDAAEVTGSTLADDVSIDFMNYPSTTSVDGKEITFTGNTFNNGNLIDAVDTSCFASASPIFTIDGVQYVGTDAQLEAALAQDVKDINVALVADLNFAGSHSNAMGGASTESVIINGNNHKLNMTSTYMPAFRLENGGGKVAISNMTIDGVMTSATTWDVYDILFYNNTEINNVTFQKAIALDGINNGTTFDLTNVTINETNGDYYAMWICANGAKVTIDGLNITTDVAASKGRAIAIKDQYVNENVEKVTLNISDATFASAKKAAILVTSAEGADITASNLNIAGVVADSEHAVWVDSDYAAHYDAVTVSGCTKWLEDAVCDINGRGYLTLQAAIAAAKDGDTINIYEGTHTLPYGLGNGIALNLTLKGAGKDKTIVNGTKNANNNNLYPGNYANGMTLVLEDLNFTTANDGYYGGFGHANSVTFRNSKIVGQFYCHSNAPHYFYDCTIDPLNGYLYTYASNVEFEGCHFAASQGKALQVYAEAAGTFNVNIKDCTFVADKQATTWDGKPVTAIDINSANGAKFVVNIDGCTATGFPTGLNSGSSLWNNKKALGDWLTLTVDGLVIEDITGGFSASADGEVVVW